jgi:Tfp pilus assembly protein PilF
MAASVPFALYNPALLPADTWAYFGNLLGKDVNRKMEAEAMFRKAIELNPAGSDCWSWFGNFLNEQPGRDDEAERVFVRQSLWMPQAPLRGPGWLAFWNGSALAR